jgi:hypothetical protein
MLMVKFHQYDLNKINENKFIDDYGKADIVFCCAIDAYIDDKINFYKFISNITKEICYFETNSNIRDDKFKEIMKDNNFDIIINLGTSKSDKGYGRKSYILIKKNGVNEIKEEYEKKEYTKNIFYTNNYYIYIYHDTYIFNKIKDIYQKIKNIKGIQKLDFFNDNIMISPIYENQLSSNNFSKDDKLIIKNQLIDIIRQLNNKNVAHRDIHTKNAFFHNNELIIIDLDFIENDNANILDCYDLTGQGLKSPLYSKNMNVFKLSEKFSFINFFDNELVIEDFIK